MTSSDSPMAEAIESALVAGDFEPLRSHLAPDVVWADCTGPDAIVDMVTMMQASGLTAAAAQSTQHPDRVVVSLDVQGGPDQGSFETHHVLFTEGDQIVEIVDVPSAAESTSAKRLGPFPSTDAQVAMTSVAPVLPVSDVTAALAHYAKLGFRTESYDGAGYYGYAHRGDVSLHVSLVPGIDPATSNTAIYLYVDDAKALYAQWRDADVSGRIVAPHDTDYGLCEGAHIDPDGNLLRFGSPIS